MKKTIIKIVLILSIFGLNIIWWISVNAGEEKPLTVTVTEKIPWAKCDCVKKVWETCPESIYKCEVKKWFWGVMDMMGSFIKYFTFLAALWGVLFIVYNGIMYSMSWIDQSFKDESKKRIIQTLVWLVVLFLSWIILNLVAPWVYVL